MLGAPECCKDLSSLPYVEIERGSTVSFEIDERTPVFAFPTAKSHFHAFILPRAEQTYYATLRSYLTNAEVSVLTSSVFCPVVTLLDENYKIRADYLRPLAFNKPDEASRNIPLHFAVSPADRYLIIHTEDVLTSRTISLDLGPAAPTFPLAVGSAIVALPKLETILEPDVERRVHHLVPCVYTGKMDLTLPER
jgi:hypothetical protein